MMYTVPMAILDFIPVLLFGVTGHLLRRNLCEGSNRSAYTLVCTGTIDVFMAGALKALYKLLYALNICDFRPLQQMLLPLQALGFVMAGVGLFYIVTGKKKRTVLYSVAPVLYTGVFAFVILMILGLAGINISLILIAKKLKKPVAIAFFVISFTLSLVMGGLSSQDLTLGSVNWLAESVNTFSQLTLLLGVLILHRAGFGFRKEYA